MRTVRHPRFARRLTPIALATWLAVGTGGLNAAPISFAGTGSFWNVATNWVGGLLPGVSDDVLLGAFDTNLTSNFSILSITGTGRLNFSAGTLALSNLSSIGAITLSGGTLVGSGALSITGPSTWSAGSMSGAGSTTFAGALTLDGGGLKDIQSRTVNFNGTTTWTTPTAAQGRIRTGSAATLTNTGTWQDQNTLDNRISNDLGGAQSAFVNAGSYLKSGAGTTSIDIRFDNTASGAGTGVVQVSAGRLHLGGGGTSNGSFSGNGTLNFSGGTHNLLAASSVTNASVAFSGGTTTLAGSYSAASGSTFSGGTANFTGTVANSGGALVFTANGGTANFNNAAGVQFSSLTMASGTIGGSQSVTINGASSWTSGTMADAGSTTFAGALTLDGGGLKDIRSRTVNFDGTTTWTTPTAAQGRIRTGSAATLTNAGTWQDQNTLDNRISNDLGGAQSAFVNAGSYLKSGAGTTSIDIRFDNTASGAGTGVVQVSAGRLHLGGGGTSNGSFSGNGTLNFSGGTHNLLAASSVTNASVLFSGGTTTLAGAYNTANGSTFNGGTANFTGTVANNGGTLVFTANGGTADFNNAAGVQFSSLTMASGTIGGNQSVTINGASSWTSGTMADGGSTTFAGALTLDGAGHKDIRSRAANFDGTTTWTTPTAGQGRIRTGSAATLTNNGIWQDQNSVDNRFSNDFGGTGSRFINAGTYSKSGAGTTTIGIGFENTSSGVVNLNAGQLILSSGSTNSGSLVLASGTTLEFGSGTHTLGGSISSAADGRLLLSGGVVNNTTVKSFGGQLTVAGGQLNSGAAFTATNLLLSSGSLGGAGALTVTGPAIWQTGTLADAGSTTFAGALTLDGAGLKDIQSRTVNFDGTTTWTTPTAGQGRIRTGSAATLTNSGTWQDQNSVDNRISNDFGGAGSRFINAGTYSKSGAGTTTIGIGFENTSAGVVNLNAGQLILSSGSTNSGSLVLASGTTLEFGSGTHTLGGSISSAANSRLLLSGGVVNNTTVKSYGGQLTVAGGQLNSGAAFTATNLLLSSGSQGGAGALTVTGPATWQAGTLADAGSTTFAGALTLETSGLKDIQSRTVNFDGTTTWTTPTAGQGRIRTGSGATLTNSGTWQDQNSVDNRISNDFGGAGSRFINAGTYSKSGAGTTTIGIGFENTSAGVVNVNAGQLILSSGSTNSGSLVLASGTTLEFGSGTHTLGGSINSAANGRLLLSGGVVNNTTVKSFGGQLTVAGGQLNTGAAFTTTNLLLSSGSQGGAGALTVTGPATWQAGTLADAGSTTFAGALTLETSGLKDIQSRTVNFDGTTTWTTPTAAQGRIRTGSGATLANNGTWQDQNSVDNRISNDFGGAGSQFINAGTYSKSGVGTTTIGIAATNQGTVHVQAGVLALTGGLTNFSGTVLTGGIYSVAGSSTLSFNGANVVTSAAGIVLDGAGSRLLNASTSTDALANFTTNTADGRFTIQNGRNFTSAANFTNSGVVTVGSASTFTVGGSFFTNNAGGTLQMAGGTLAGTALSNAGDVAGFGTIHPTVANTGQVLASGGTLNLLNGVQGSTGAVQVAAGATLSLAASTLDSSAGTVALAGNLDLGARTLQVFSDYDNTGFGSGNSFNARANVAGLGSIVGMDAAMAITGSTVTAAAAPNTVTLNLGTVRGGTSASRSFQVANTGTGASLRGAVQTAGAASITDTRLSGAGVQAGNFGPVAAGQATAPFNVTLNANSSTGGALSGQSLRVVSNFDNVIAQTIQIAGFTTVLAQGAAAPAGPVDLGNFRIGGTPAARSANLDITNLTTGAGAERLALLSTSTSGNFSARSLLVGSLVTPGATTPGAEVSTASGVAGVNNGSVTLQFGSNGQAFDASFATQATNQQTVDLVARGYLVAQPALPASVALGNFRVTDGASRSLTLTNTALAPAGFQEVLNATAGATSAGVTLIGAVNGLAAGNSSSNFTIGMAAGGVGGVRNGTASLNLVSDGAGTSGLGLFGLPGAQVAVSGTAFNLAAAAVLPATPLTVANQRVGDTARTALTITNTGVAGNFTEALNARIASRTGAATSFGTSFSDLAAGASNSLALGVGIDTSSAGLRSGTVTLAFQSDGTGANGRSGLAAIDLADQTVSVSGSVFRLATASAAAPSPVVLANQRVGGTASQALTVGNTATADGFSERLNASIAANGTATATGSFGLLAAGGVSSALSVGVNTSTAGAKSGVATITLASDGAGTSGFSALGIGGQQVSVSGNVFRLATASAASPSPVVLANQRVGGTASQVLTVGNTAAADGFSERLNASIAANGTATATGAFSLLAAGSVSNALGVGVNTSTAGAKSGVATITLASDGTAAGNSGFSAFALNAQQVSVSGNVFRLATASAAAPSPVVLANQRVGGTASQVLTVGNTAAADGFSERLNASIAANGTATAAGSFSLLAAGASSNALTVGVNTGTAGAKSGVATITLASDGTGTSGFSAFDLGTQTVNVSGNVYRLAQANAVTPGSVTLAAQRVGGTASQALTVANLATNDGFSERLNATIGASGGATATGVVSQLAAGGSSQALRVGVDASTAGAKSGTASITLASDGTGTSGFSASGIGSQQVTVQGNVYAPAVARLDTPAVNFGTVRVGDVVAARSVQLANTATGGLTDRLVASLAGGGAPFAASGSGDAAAGAMVGGLTVQLDTTGAGVFDSMATLTLASRNTEMADQDLGTLGVALQGQVNNLAVAALGLTAGSGSFTATANGWRLDFGAVLQGSGLFGATLALSNAASGPADALAGSFDLSNLGGAFSASGFGPFSGIAAGATLAGLGVQFDSSNVGSFSRVIALNGFSTNGSGPDLALAGRTLELTGAVAAVPEPGTYALMLGGLLLVAGIARRRAAAA